MNNTFEPVGIAVVGCGNISDQYLTNLVRFPDLNVVSCADIDLSRASAQAAKYGVPHSADLATVLEMPNVELIINLTIPAVHASVALQAIRAGKHVYGEKPFALSIDEAETIIAAAAKHNVHLGNAPDTFLGAGLQTARRVIESGQIGTPISARATFGYAGPDAWHPNPEFLFQKGGGPLLDMGPYYLTALIQLFGPVKTVSGFGRRPQRQRTIGSGPRAGESFEVTVDTQISALLEFASGPIANTRFSFDEPIATRELEVYGTGAAMRLPDPNAFDGSVFVCKKDLNKTSPQEWLNAPTDADWTEFPAQGSAEGRGMGALDLARAVRTGKTPRASADLARHVLDVMESIARSIASGQSISVATTCELAEPLPATWNPLQKSTE